MKKYKIQSFHVYPIKSLYGINVENPEATPRGFLHDRSFMLVDQNGDFVTQRNHAQLCLFKTKFSSQSIQVSFGESQINVPLESAHNALQRVNIWDDELMAHTLSKEINDWFSTHLSMNLKLVSFGNQSIRNKHIARFKKDIPISFSDGYPYLLIGTASLDKLNQQLESAISMDRFRGNIIVETDIPHIEDTWDQFQIGECLFQNVKPCPRCPVINIEQSNGEQNKAITKVLSSYRKFDNNILFGMNAICMNPGTITESIIGVST